MRPIKKNKKKDRYLLYLAFGIAFILLFTFLIFVQNGELSDNEIIDYTVEIESPKFSNPGGVFDDSFELEITHNNSNCEIYYTLDGSRPTLQSRHYKGSILIDSHLKRNKDILQIPTSPIWRAPINNQRHGVIVRAVSYCPKVGYSKVTNGLYYPKGTLNHPGFDIVNIVIDPDSLFDPLKGIYVLGEEYYSKKKMIRDNRTLTLKWWEYSANYHQRGQKWEREATIILMDKDGKPTISQDIGIRINGQNTRAYPQKSLRIIADEKYGEPYLNFPLFKQTHYQKFKTFLLRNSGNDWDRTLFNDALMHLLSKNTNSDLQAYSPAVLYINGNYWGIHNIRERQDEYYLAHKYKTDISNITMLRSPQNVDFGLPEAGQSLANLLEYLQNNSLKDSTNFEYVSNQIDIDHFIDYLTIETFFVNTDWPFNNIKIYKFHAQNDYMVNANVKAEKWRWMIYDLDYGFNHTDPESHKTNMFNHIKRFNKTPIHHLFFSMLENTKFREKFSSRYKTIIQEEFNTERILTEISRQEALYEPEIDRQISRWRKPNSKRRWFQEIEKMRSFARERPSIALEHLEQLVDSYN